MIGKDRNNLVGLLENSRQIEPTSILPNHYDGISDLSLNPQNKSLLAASSFDSLISIYDVNSLKETMQLKGHNKGVWTISYSPNSSQIISGGSDCKSILWDASSGKPIKTFANHKKSIYDAQFSTTGRYFATCSKDCICIWDVNQLNKPLDLLTESKAFIYCLNFLDNDTKLITGFIDGTLIIHTLGNQLKDDKFLETIPKGMIGQNPDDIYNRSIYSMELLNKDKNQFLLTHADGSVRLYSYNEEKNNLKLEDTYFFFTGATTCARCNEDDTRIIASSKDRTAEVWSFGNHNAIEYTLIGNKNIVSSALFLDNNKVATASFDCTVKIYNCEPY